MIEYVVHKMSVRGSEYISFEFIPSNKQLSGFLFSDSKLMFGKDYKDFEEIMKSEHYNFSGNAYSVEMLCDAVQITCDIDCEGDDLFLSDIISRDDFVWVMNEWIRENKNLRSNDSENKAVYSTKMLRKQNKLLSKVCRLFGKR